MTHDPKNELTFSTLLAAKSQATNNTAGTVIDLQQYIHGVAVRVNIGLLSAGDNNSTFTVQLQDSATNNASNATNIAGASVAMGVSANNTATSGTIALDPRAQLRYVFPRIIITGANSPAAPLTVEAIGTKKTQ